MLGDEGKEVEIALRVAHHAGELLHLVERKVAVVILDALLLQLGAIFGREREFVAAALRLAGLFLVPREERLRAARAHAVGPAAHLHLEDAEVDAQLDLVAPVQAGNAPDLDLARFEGPAGKDAVEVEAHVEAQ